MIGAGAEAPDQKLQAAVAGQRCKPANRMQMQLWKKALVTEQEKFEAQQTNDRGSSSAGQGRETVTGQAGQYLPAVGRRNPSRCAQKNEVGTLGTSTDKVPNIQKTVNRVRSWKWPKTGRFHTTVGRYEAATAAKGGCTDLVQTAVDTVDAVEDDDDDDCISIGDWSQAFQQALAFDEDLPPKFVSYRPYKGAKLRIF